MKTGWNKTVKGCEAFYDGNDACSVVRALVAATTEPEGRECVRKLGELVPGYWGKCRWTSFGDPQPGVPNDEFRDCYTAQYTGLGVACSMGKSYPREDEDPFGHYVDAREVVRHCLPDWKLEDGPRRPWQHHAALEAVRSSVDASGTTSTRFQVCAYTVERDETILDSAPTYMVKFSVFTERR